uniref:Dehydrogenase/reductase (SDR family) X-linked n=1 Tax=Hucho hucho TaxID=62062 RepID=A0A4W5NEL4_9TELE
SHAKLSVICWTGWNKYACLYQPIDFPLYCKAMTTYGPFLFLPHTVLPKQNGRVAIVTGGARGMGYETARHLASLGMHVVIAGFLFNSLFFPPVPPSFKFTFYIYFDKSKAVSRVGAGERRGRCLSVLIEMSYCLSFIAGIMLVPEGKTEDSFELHFGLNYLGHFLLTNLLLDKLKRSGKHDACSRVVTMSSATHYVGRLNMEDLQGRSGYSAHGAYSQSKLALVLFTYHLQEKLAAGGFPVTSNAVDPGMVDTDLYNNLCIPAQAAKKPVAKMLFRTPAEGASTAILAATASQLEGVGGCYFYNGERIESADMTYDHNVRAELWKQSCALVGLQEA